ncbi:MAG: S-layer homology domain-containing protein [Clostridiales bacterium]|nr:S-layer homology domain-containing protein [Clostridiales bacterium]
MTSTYGEGVPLYRFAIPGTSGSLSLGFDAFIEYKEYYKQGVSEPGSMGVPTGNLIKITDTFDGLAIVTYTIVSHGNAEDGTLGQVQPIARLEFLMGQAVQGYPEDMLSWENSNGSVQASALPKKSLSSISIETPSPWAADQVKAAIQAGLVADSLQSSYQSPISRGNVAKLFVGLVEKSSGKSINEVLASKGLEIDKNSFSDTADESILSVYALGIVAGVGEGKYAPTESLTRAQMAAFINRTAKALNVETTGYSHSFTDVSDHWVDAELGWPVEAGAITGVGDGRFEPEGQLTIEQSITIAYRAYLKLKG